MISELPHEQCIHYTAIHDMQTQHPKFSIASLSLGSCTYHSLPTKIAAASILGYQGIEIFLPDFEAFIDEVKQGKHINLFSSPVQGSCRRDIERTCAKAISTLCKLHNLSIPIVQPMRNFENFADTNQLNQALDAAERWLDLMPYFDSDLLLVCSNFIEGPHPVQSGTTTMQAYLDAQVNAFRLLGKRADQYGVRIGYEPLSWGTVIDRWEHVWEVVRRVDMPNIGVILDSFNTLGNQYADPTTPTSLRKNATLLSIQSNLDLLKATIPASKLFFYQIADAHRPLYPILDMPNAPARMTWSRASRLFPCEDATLLQYFDTSMKDRANWIQTHRGFLPVVEMTRAVNETGYNGWWSLEVFNTSLMEADAGCPIRHGERGIWGLRRLWESTKQISRGTEPGGAAKLVIPPLDDEEGGETENESSELESVEQGEEYTRVNIAEETRTDLPWGVGSIANGARYAWDLLLRFGISPSEESTDPKVTNIAKA